MPVKKPDRDNRQELLEQIKRLEEEVRKLREGGASGVKADGLAEGIVTALGRMVPGLGGLIQSASQMPEFHERLAAIDEEVKQRFRDQPLRQASERGNLSAAPTSIISFPTAGTAWLPLLFGGPALLFLREAYWEFWWTGREWLC